jgi:aquaporin Z
MGLNIFVIELVGTFVLVASILRFASESWGAVAIGATLMGLIFFGGKISGGHFNPAVSLGVFLKGGMAVGTLVFTYMLSQVLGGSAAWIFYNSVF